MKTKKTSLVWFIVFILTLASCHPFVNTEPVINDQTFSVNENSPAGTVVDTVVATDIDEGQKLIFSIVLGNSSGIFSIDANTGVISIANPASLNYELTSSYELGIQVSDDYKKSLSAFASVKIYVNDILEFNAEEGCVVYYPFSGSADDLTGNNHNGTVYGATLTTDRHGNAGKAYEFDGINDYINTNSTFDYNYRTISAWLDPFEIHHAYPDNSNAIGQNSGYLDYGAFVVQFDNGIMYCNAGGSNNLNVYSNSLLTENTWFHIVLIRDGSQTRYYLNGQHVHTAVAGTDGALSTPNPILLFGVGRSTSSQYYNGKIDDVAIFNRVLSESEIAELYSK
jgi:hypothetical protein